MKENITDCKIEWVRLPGAVKMSGIGRAKMYDLIGRHEIKSACLKQPGQERGTRLINVASLREFIESKVERAQR